MGVGELRKGGGRWGRMGKRSGGLRWIANHSVSRIKIYLLPMRHIANYTNAEILISIIARLETTIKRLHQKAPMQPLPTSPPTRAVSFRALSTTTCVRGRVLRITLARVIAYCACILQSTHGKVIALPGTYR